LDEQYQKYMKKNICEYYPNGGIKHIINFYPNGNKYFEQFFDERGCNHRDPGLPDYHSWYENNISHFKTYYVHSRQYNIHNPASINFDRNGKIWDKYYLLNYSTLSKLNWQNVIKNI
jgi:hypothetical protein